MKDTITVPSDYVKRTVIRSVNHTIVVLSQKPRDMDQNLEDMTVEEFLTKKTRDVEEVILVFWFSE